MRIIILVTAIAAVICFALPAASNDESVSDDGITCVETDRDSDGNTDYLLRYDENGYKVYEELDFNYDGEMDDFYYYESGVLLRREIDTNYDKEVDVWVYIYEGVYIERYERDLDFDGNIDQIKDFATVAENTGTM